jgi:hypothetical protein
MSESTAQIFMTTKARQLAAVRTRQRRHQTAQEETQVWHLKLDMNNPADREKLRRAVLDLVAGRKMPKKKGHG